MRHRIWLSALAALLAVSAAAAAFSVRRDAAPAAAVAVPVQTGSEETEEVYLVREYNGELCVFLDGALLERTGIPVATLPRSDREQAMVGIYVTGKAALSELLGDLGS